MRSNDPSGELPPTSTLELPQRTGIHLQDWGKHLLLPGYYKGQYTLKIIKPYLPSHIWCHKVVFCLKKANRCNCWVMEETNCFPVLALSVALTYINAENFTWTAAVVQHWGLEGSKRGVLCNMWKDVQALQKLLMSRFWAFWCICEIINTGIKNHNF